MAATLFWNFIPGILNITGIVIGMMSCLHTGSIAPSLSVLSTVLTATCHRHGDSDTTLYSDDQPEQLDLNNPSLYKWQVEVCIYVTRSAKINHVRANYT